MSEHRRNKYNESASSSSDNHYSSLRPVISDHVSRVPNKRKQNKKRTKESNFVVNPVNLLQFPNFTMGQPLWQPMQPHNYNLVYGNITQAVLQPHLSQNYFHRPNQEIQRHVHTSASHVGENLMNGLRFWEKISPGPAKSGFIFSVMSYNVLAQDLLDQHPYLYNFHRKESLKWHVRWNNLLAEIRHLDPDILCLQEVQKSHLNAYFSILEHLGYRGLYKQRTGVRTDGCAIYYKPALLNLIEYTSVEFNQPNIRILDRDNVALIAKFSPKNHPKKEFVVATTHLLYNPRRHDVRLAQTQVLLTEIDRIAFNPRCQYLPVILTGDLNATPDSAVYKFITKGRLHYENLSSRSLQNGVDGLKTGKNFLPTSLRITDQCQHADLLPKRQNKAHISRSEELKLIELKHSERQCEEMNEKNRFNNDEKLFASGSLTHNFSLKSVYQHSINGDVEATTFQEEWISVDYIFFSQQRPKMDHLVVLERYRLPTRSEVGNVKIPNTNLGSDHLSLLAKFQLHV